MMDLRLVVLCIGWLFNLVNCELTIARPPGGLGALMISTDDIEDDDYRSFDHLMVHFDYQCLKKQAGFTKTIQSVQQAKVDSLVTLYPCLSPLMDRHFPRSWDGVSVTYFEITDITDVATDYESSCIFDDSIVLDYTADCLQMFYHEPILEFTLDYYNGDYMRLTSEEYDCKCDNTVSPWVPTPYEAWGLDQMDDEILNNKYCYPEMEDIDTGVDIFILDTGIRGSHEEFESGQVSTPSSYTKPSVNRASGHGTHVAGLAGGKEYGSSKYIDNIYDYQVFSDGSNVNYLHYVESALFDILLKLSSNNRRGVVNLSFGQQNVGQNTQNMYNGYFSAIQAVGGVVVVSAGNEDVDVDATNRYPAASPNSITVGAVGRSLIKASYSNHGNGVDLWAPGGTGIGSLSNQIISAWDDGDTSYGFAYGTSMAAPYIAGVIANMLFVDPTLTQTQVLNSLLSNTLTVSGDECDSQTCLFPIYSCGECDLPQYVKCEEKPCDCTSEDDSHCSICDANGCDLCETGYFKKDYNHPCTSCSEMFGEGCLFCQDLNGCGQCAQGYQRELDPECGLYKCVEDSSEILIPCDADVIFGIDESGSVVNAGLFPSETGFVNDVIDIMELGANIGALTFGSVARAHYQLDDDQDRNAVKGAINSIIASGGGTQFNPALVLAQSMFANGDIDNPDVLVLVTDGSNSDATAACDTAATMLASGIEIVVIGIGQDFMPMAPAITCLVNDPNTQIMHADSFDENDLELVIYDVTRAACGGDCPIECNNEPCKCSELAHCNVCHSNGCNECDSGYFKKQYNYQCENCQLITGQGCKFCQDFNGCGECKTGYYRVFDDDCGLWVCQ